MGIDDIIQINGLKICIIFAHLRVRPRLLFKKTDLSYRDCLGCIENDSLAVLNGDLGIWALKSYRLVSMIKSWLRVIQLPNGRLLNSAGEKRRKTPKYFHI